jgi:hypothetical protein
MKPEDVQYIIALQQVSVDIMNSPHKAREFSSNPKSFLMKYGYNGYINLDDGLLKITMALGDEDINNSITKRDFKSFVELCIDKNLISSSEGIFSDSFYKDQLEEIYKKDEFKKLAQQMGLTTELRSSTTVDTFFLPFVLVIAAAAAVVAAIWAFVVWQESVYVEGLASDDGHNLANDLNMIDIYSLKAGMENTYVAVDKYTEGIVDESISILQKVQPDIFNNNSETEVRNLIKVNVVNNLGKLN